MEQEREGEIERLRKRQATTPHRTAKRSRLLEAKLRSNTVIRAVSGVFRRERTTQLARSRDLEEWPHLAVGVTPAGDARTATAKKQTKFVLTANRYA